MARQALIVRVIMSMKAAGTATMQTFPTDLVTKNRDMDEDWDDGNHLLGTGHDEDKGGEGGDAQHHEDLVPQPAQLPQTGVLPVQHLIISPRICTFPFHMWACVLKPVKDVPVEELLSNLLVGEQVKQAVP